MFAITLSISSSFVALGSGCRFLCWCSVYVTILAIKHRQELTLFNHSWHSSLVHVLGSPVGSAIGGNIPWSFPQIVYAAAMETTPPKTESVSMWVTLKAKSTYRGRRSIEKSVMFNRIRKTGMISVRYFLLTLDFKRPSSLVDMVAFVGWTDELVGEQEQMLTTTHQTVDCRSWLWRVEPWGFQSIK